MPIGRVGYVPLTPVLQLSHTRKSLAVRMLKDKSVARLIIYIHTYIHMYPYVCICISFPYTNRHNCSNHTLYGHPLVLSTQRTIQCSALSTRCRHQNTYTYICIYYITIHIRVSRVYTNSYIYIYVTISSADRPSDAIFFSLESC